MWANCLLAVARMHGTDTMSPLSSYAFAYFVTYQLVVAQTLRPHSKRNTLIMILHWVTHVIEVKWWNCKQFLLPCLYSVMYDVKLELIWNRIASQGPLFNCAIDIVCFYIWFFYFSLSSFKVQTINTELCVFINDTFHCTCVVRCHIAMHMTIIDIDIWAVAKWLLRSSTAYT